MSNDPVLGTMAYPCEACGAASGEECAENCPGMQDAGDYATEWELSALASDLNGIPPVVRPMDESLAILAEAVHKLPYGNLVGLRGLGAPDRQDFDPQEYVARLADWMAAYQPILRAELDDLQRQSLQRISLEMERDMVRNYLKGVPV